MDDTAPVRDQWEQEEADLRRAVTNARDHQMATTFTLWFGLACEYYPEHMRRAVEALIPDLKALLKRVETIAARANQNGIEAVQAHELLTDLKREIDRQEKRRDTIIAQLDQLERKIKARDKRENEAQGSLRVHQSNGEL